MSNHVDLYLDALKAVDRFADDETIERGQRKASLEELVKEIVSKIRELRPDSPEANQPQAGADRPGNLAEAEEIAAKVEKLQPEADRPRTLAEGE